MNFEFHPEALLEYRDAAHYYDRAVPGLGLRFASAVENAVRSVATAPQRWPEIAVGLRRCRTRTFPYSVIYSVAPERVLMLAIAHARREPGYWRERL